MVRVWIHLRDHNLRVVGNLHALVVIQEFLVQLLPFSQAGKLDLNVLSYLFAGKLDHSVVRITFSSENKKNPLYSGFKDVRITIKSIAIHLT